MPIHAETQTQTLRVLGASVEHRKGERRLFVRTEAGAATLVFPETLGVGIGRTLAAPAPKPGPVTKVPRAPIAKPSGGLL